MHYCVSAADEAGQDAQQYIAGLKGEAPAVLRTEGKSIVTKLWFFVRRTALADLEGNQPKALQPRIEILGQRLNARPQHF